jgi:hypothetical protein
MARKRFVWGVWREVLESGVAGQPCPVPSEAEKELIGEQERLAGMEFQPLVLKGGEKCPCCGARLEFVENRRCAKCKNEFYVEASALPREAATAPAWTEPPVEPPPPGTRIYKVITQRDEFFASKFNPEGLERLLNQHAREGWRVVSMTATDVGSFLGSFWGKGGGAARQELVVLLERDA